jgi:hypothetical protein
VPELSVPELSVPELSVTELSAARLPSKIKTSPRLGRSHHLFDPRREPTR